MSSSVTSNQDLPVSQYNLNTYWGRVQHCAAISDPRTLFVSNDELESAKNLIAAYRQGSIRDLDERVWKAKKIVDSTLHPDTGAPVFLPFRMSCYVMSNLVVTAGMLTPNLSRKGIIFWQIANQSLNVAINHANANKSTPLSVIKTTQSYFLAVGASCSVALGLNALVPRLKRLSPSTRTVLTRLAPFVAVASAGALNVFLMRSEEIRKGIDVYPVPSKSEEVSGKLDGNPGSPVASLGKSKKAGIIAVSETALSRVLNSSPNMIIPPLILLRLQKHKWLKKNPRLVLPINLGLVLATSIFALPLALAAFPQIQTVDASLLESEFWRSDEDYQKIKFNRGI
ncbi:Bgt-4769 [Blumeria graminis f. sp. tritici]|uniref:Sidoreflexin n=2 Tax=Blumeria graminis f. sp. tritici TaxID=62690 RepID=A0A061HF13_BLUGR|nr:hypothetical protein BGT96224_4769 [Blumeria graminis f. sp. tritici 96224]VCU41043.1 Bgt-4769 [Blumeria graminis f. sp. tritici]